MYRFVQSCGMEGRGVVRVGVVGQGSLGRYLAEQVQAREGLELAWVWNRTPPSHLPDHLVLTDLARCDQGNPDIIVEVAHPDITKEFGARFLQVILNSPPLHRWQTS